MKIENKKTAMFNCIAAKLYPNYDDKLRGLL